MELGRLLSGESRLSYASARPEELDMHRIILRNMARCKKCGDEIESKHTHDFVTCGCGSISVDGGKDYLKRSGISELFEDLTEYKEV